jgi:ribosomal protein S18 acetylase RimI-like enzyme
MAARLQALAPHPEILDLRRVAANDLEPLLIEESAEWMDELAWEFSKSADLVRRFVDLRALTGSALVEGRETLGYAYYVLEDNRGLVGDLYVRRQYRTPERERLLLESVIQPLLARGIVSRIESQLLMLSPPAADNAPCPELMQRYERNFMLIPLRGARLAEGKVRRPVYIEKWSDHYQDGAAALISAAYSSHVDSSINEQYRSPGGARRFLHNIVQYPGCGTFYRPASFAAFDAVTGRICGISLASLVSTACGHITQICVSPEARHTGTGYELLRRSLTVLQAAQCESASLTVTASNERAVSLYERVGFRTTRRFYAFVWEHR